MYLTRHLTAHGARRAVDNHFLAHQFELGMLMELPQSRIADVPQAKVYNGSAAIGPGIVITGADEMTDLPIQLEIRRGGKPVFQGDTNTGQIKRPLQELADYLLKELHFPQGVLLLTGAGIVPPDDFTLQQKDELISDIERRSAAYPRGWSQTPTEVQHYE